jgi:hypothetical protein
VIRALAWKEYREQRAVWLAMACFAGLVLVVFVPWLLSATLRPEERRAFLVAAGGVLAWAYGVVCGAMLLAGEREEGTLAFLEELPARRGQVWMAKFLTGAGLVLVFGVLVATVLACVLRFANAWEPVALVLAGLSGLGWGLAFSATGSNVLAVIGWAMGAQVVVSLALLALLLVTRPPVEGSFTRSFGIPETIIVIVNTLLSVAALLRSRAIYCLAEQPQAARGAGQVPLLAQTDWPTRPFALGLGLASLAAGLAVIILGGGLWLLATMLVGVACGVAAFAGRRDSLASTVASAWVWMGRTLSHGLLAVAATVLVALPPLFRAVIEEGIPPIEPRGSSMFLAVGVMYGFTFGVLFSVIFRSPRAAAAVAIPTALLGIALWFPLMSVGGLHFLQIAYVPGLALLTSALVWTGRQQYAKQRIEQQRYQR